MKCEDDVHCVHGGNSAKSSGILCVEVLNALRELEELRHREAMETALIDYSSGEKFSGVHDFKTASTSEHKRLTGASLAKELADVMVKPEYRELGQCKLKAVVESDRGLPSDCGTGKLCRGSSKGKEILQANEVEKLSRRLTVLEEENGYMKQVFLNTLKERRMLLNEIYQQFQEMHHCFHYRHKLTGDRSYDGSLVAIPCEHGTLQRGRSQVLCQESSPCVVTRHNKKSNISGYVMTLLDMP